MDPHFEMKFTLLPTAFSPHSLQTYRPNDWKIGAKILDPSPCMFLLLFAFFYLRLLFQLHFLFCLCLSLLGNRGNVRVNSNILSGVLQKHFDICQKFPVHCTNKCGLEEIPRGKVCFNRNHSSSFGKGHFHLLDTNVYQDFAQSSSNF